MSLFHNNPLIGASGSGTDEYTIERSLRFNKDDSAHLSKIFSSTGSRTTFTISAWFKRVDLPSSQYIFVGGSGTNSYLMLDGNQLRFLLDGGATGQLKTNAIYRDVSAWMHVIVVGDSTNATSSDRLRMYVNGERITSFATETQPSQSANLGDFNTAAVHYFNRLTSGNYGNIYLADCIFLDGTAATASDFGEFDDNNVWQPIAYTGTYGTNGFHLDFSDNSTAAALGTDTSGNGNTWTVNNITASEYRVIDAPTLLNGAMIVRGVSGGSVTVTISGAGNKNYFTSSDGIDWTWQSTATSATYSANYIASGGAGTNSRIAVSNGAFQYAMWNTNTNFDSGSNTTTDTTGLTFTTATANGSNADSLLDSPQNGTQTDTGAGGEVSGNYATLNPLQVNNTASPTFSNGNLEITDTGQSGYNNAFSTIGVSSGKWYVECTNEVGAFNFVGIQQGPVTDGYIGNDAAGNGWSYAAEGYLRHARTNKAYGSVTYGAGDVIGIALDLDSATKTLTFYKNGTSLGIAYSGSELDADVYTFGGTLYTTNDKQIWNFGQRPFAYSAPSGYKALCTTNLDDPTIADGSTYFDAITYDGTQVTRSITGLDFGPDLVWTKSRSNPTGNELYDSVRGAQELLYSNSTDTETTVTNGISSFNSDGWTMGNRSGLNYLGRTYVAWAWDAGSSTVSNTDGDVTSSVRANTSAGFSIVKWNPDSNGQSVGHGLNAVPEFIMAKALDNGHSWRVYHKDLTSGENLLLDTDLIEDVYLADIDIVNSTVFDGGQGLTGSSLDNNIAYCFTSVEGYSSFGRYTGNNSTDGPFVYTGFRPRFLLVKGYDITVSWQIYDSERNTFNLVDDELYPNLTDVENNQAVSGGFDFLSNGFKVRSVDSWLNSNSNNYIYAAFAERPFKYVRAQ